jgi:hypothetical protein
MSEDRDEPRHADMTASPWARGERVVPMHLSPLPDRDQLWELHKQRNWIERDRKERPPPRPRGIQRRV